MSKKKKLPVITVRYDGRYDEPTVLLPPGIEAEVRLVDQTAADLHVLTFKGVSVYQTIKDDMGASGYLASDCWMATQPGLDWEDRGVFDVRKLWEAPDEFKKKYRKREWTYDQLKLAHAIAQGWITEESVSIPDAAII